MSQQTRGRLDGKVAIVTGAARGVGAETARVLHGEGASVVIGDVVPSQAMEMHVHQILEPAHGRPRNNRMRDIANMVLFLASDEGAGCTAGDFMVDGGYSAGRRVVTGTGDWG